MLDVGAGRGVVASRVKGASARADVWAVEPEEGRVHSMNRNHMRVRGVMATAEWLPFPDAFFDKAYATLSLHHFADAPIALGEIARVLKEGGRFIILEINPHSAKGRLFRVLGRLAGEKMTLRTREELSKMVASTERFRVERSAPSGSLYLLQATRI